MNGMVATGYEGHQLEDIVAHVKEPHRLGAVKVVEDNNLSVMIQWDDMPEGELDFQWANKVVRVHKETQ